MNKVNSLAGTGKPYLKGQVRVKVLDDKPVFHIQVLGPRGNRTYGYALDVEITPELAMLGLAFALSPVSKKSLAGTDKEYFVAQFAPRYGGQFNMQTANIPPFNGNRKYGNAIVLRHAGFSAWLTKVLG